MKLSELSLAELLALKQDLKNNGRAFNNDNEYGAAVKKLSEEINRRIKLIDFNA